ncbi:MAG: hypothetical protein IJZ44_06375 [Lachnospiraceae bacterium]|nr:hypothetical protein [Lachnospiraceae bacterium]
MDNNNMMNNGDNMQFDPNNPYNMGTQPQYDMNNQAYNNMGYQQYGYQQPYQGDIYRQPGEGSGVDGKAVGSLVCGILGILLCCCYGIPGIILGIIAIVLAIMAKRDNMGTFPGIALAGMICGIVAVVAGAIFIVCMIVGIMQEL